MNRKTFSELLKKSRLAKGYTQPELAIKINSTKQSVNDWEHERSVPTFDILINLADALNVSLDYLVGRTDDPNPKVSCELANELTSLNERQLKTVEAVINSFKE